jgi:hypothetical protein
MVWQLLSHELEATKRHACEAMLRWILDSDVASDGGLRQYTKELLQFHAHYALLIDDHQHHTMAR